MDEEKQDQKIKEDEEHVQLAPLDVPDGQESEENEYSSDSDMNREMSESLRHLPPSVRRTFMGIFQGKGPMDGHPLFEKFSSNHIDKFLDLIKSDDQNQFEYHSSNRWFYLGYTILAILFFFGTMWVLLPIDKNLFQDILKIFVAFAGGLGSGFGLKSHLDKKK